MNHGSWILGPGWRLMASSSETCFFCGDDVENPQHGWSFKNSTNAQICRLCFLTLEQGTFCQLFHTHEDGWKNCDNCRKPIHYGCIMAFNTFEQNGTYAVTCKECIMKSGHVGDAASPMLNSKDCVQLGSSGSFTDMLLGEEFAEEATELYPLSDDIKNSHEMATEGSLKISESCNDVKNTHEVVIEEGLNISEPENPDLLFLFEKKLAPSDCDPKLGRLLVPKQLAEKYLPQVDGLQSMPLTVEDVGGRSWEFVLRWWLNKRSRKYVFYGTRKCVETMQWNAGDKIKFYRKPSNGRLIIELERTHTITSESDASVPGDGANI